MAAGSLARSLPTPQARQRSENAFSAPHFSYPLTFITASPAGKLDPAIRSNRHRNLRRRGWTGLMENKRLVVWITGHAGSPAMTVHARARLICVKRPLSLGPRIFQGRRAFARPPGRSGVSRMRRSSLAVPALFASDNS
jgi:hypothetical protein